MTRCLRNGWKANLFFLRAHSFKCALLVLCSRERVRTNMTFWELIISWAIEVLVCPIKTNSMFVSFSQASLCPLASLPFTSCSSWACARGGRVTSPSASSASALCVWWLASLLLVTSSACTCTRVCWPRRSSPLTVCGPGEQVTHKRHTHFGCKTGSHLMGSVVRLGSLCVGYFMSLCFAPPSIKQSRLVCYLHVKKKEELVWASVWSIGLPIVHVKSCSNFMNFTGLVWQQVLRIKNQK